MKTITIKHINTSPVTCRVDYDDNAESPREWDNLGVMVTTHRRYDMPNECGFDFDRFDGWDEIEKHLRKEHDAFIVLPIQMYEHGGTSIYVGNTHDTWDGGQLGFIFATKEAMRNWWCVKRVTKAIQEQTIKALTQEVEAYDKYVSGSIYYYSLTDARGELIDSCGGWYDTEDIKSELEDYENITWVGELVV